MSRFSLHLTLPRPHEILLAMVCGLQLTPALAHPPGHRLDPVERARLRQEMRQQAWGLRPAEPTATAGQAAVAPGHPPVVPPQAPGPAIPALAPAYPPQSPALPHPSHPPMHAIDLPHHPRLSPEERRQLRLQLLEERQRRREASQAPIQAPPAGAGTQQPAGN